MKSLILLLFVAAINAQDNRPWPIGSGPQQPNSGQFGPAGGQQTQFGQPIQPIGGGQPFGQNLPGQNSQQPWMAGSNPQFASGGSNPNPQFGNSNAQFVNQVPGLQGGAIPPNNPPPGTVTGADRAAVGGGSNPQWGNNPNQPQWGNPGQQPNQPWQQPGGQQGNWQQPGPGQPGQGNWNNDPNRNFGGPNPNDPRNSNNIQWGNNQQNPNQQSTPYPVQRGPWAGANTSRHFSLFSLIAFICLTRLFV